MKRKRQFTVGCDPEYFLKERQTGRLISAIPFIKGTKHEPQKLPAGGVISFDNVALEVATDVAASADDFVKNVGDCLRSASAVIPPEMDLVAVASANFEPDQLDHEEAKRFGCDPDYNAWTMEQNEPPCAMDMTFRSAGAHIHVGSPILADNFENMMTMVKLMDCIHGVVSTILDSSPEAVARRELYGKPGAHRPKDYGIEYRVLSSYWTKSPVTVMMMYHLCDDALNLLEEGTAEDFINEIDGARVQEVISTGDADAAAQLFETHVLPRLSEDSIHYFNTALAKVRANDMHMDKEWELKRKEAS